MSTTVPVLPQILLPLHTDAGVDESKDISTLQGAEQNLTQLINAIVADVSETLKGTISTYNNQHYFL